MLTRLSITRFKKIKEADVELGGHIVFVGPNNSGKTSALQALSLWHYGLMQWVAEKSDGASGKKRYGVTLNRKDLLLCRFLIQTYFGMTCMSEAGQKTVRERQQV